MTQPLPWPVPAPSAPDAPRRTQARPTVGLFLAAVLAVAGAAVVLTLMRGRTPAGAGSGNGAVVIETNLAYQGSAAAGTGIVLSSSGEILTNNHVIHGATSIDVVVPGTGR